MGAAGPPAQAPRPATARELQAVIRAERKGVPFFVYRNPTGEQILRFGCDPGRLTVGRSPAADLCLSWDQQVSALHAMLECLAGELTLLDDGLSRNGSYVNGERVHSGRRLRDRDVLRFGHTTVLVRSPFDAQRHSTVANPTIPRAVLLSEQQRNVLIALCRPLLLGDRFSFPATNQQIANELHLSIPSVKLHLRALFDKLEVADLPHNKKRLALAARALGDGLITEHELGPEPNTDP
jgi:pSer/pThr/pTyr-binding forkhead associated (FHA) protein